MILVKKLVIAPLFLLVFALLIYQLTPLFASYDYIFSLSWTTLIQLTILAGLILLISLLFNLFVTLSQDWKLSLPIGVAAALIPLLLTRGSLGLVLAIGTAVSLLLTYLTLENKLKTYLTFEPNSLLGPSVRQLAGLLVLVICLTYFLSINKTIQQQGFQIPDSLIDTALKFAAPPPESNQQPQTTQPQLTPEQIELLKKNPDLLKQYGIDPKILDNLNQPAKSSREKVSSAQDVLKQTVKDQLQNLLKPYSGFIPAVLAILLFLTLQSLTSILNLLIYPLLWIIFYLLEKSGIVKFVVEQRPVKKIVV